MIWPDLNKQIPACWPGHPSIIQITHHLHQFLDFTKNIQTLFHFVASLAYELNYTVGTLISHRKIAPLSACLLDKQRSPCIKFKHYTEGYSNFFQYLHRKMCHFHVKSSKVKWKFSKAQAHRYYFLFPMSFPSSLAFTNQDPAEIC